MGKLTGLDLQDKSLGPSEGFALAELLKDNKTATCLHVMRNGLRAAGAQAVSEMLKVNNTLTKLDLSDNEIGAWTQEACEETDWEDKIHSTPEGPAALAHALKSNSCLLCLKVFGNAIDQVNSPNLDMAFRQITRQGHGSLCGLEKKNYVKANSSFSGKRRGVSYFDFAFRNIVIQPVPLNLTISCYC